MSLETAPISRISHLYCTRWYDSRKLKPRCTTSCFGVLGAVLCVIHHAITNRHPQSTARSSTESQEQQRRVHWNTEMLSYTVYAADECGKMTTWDLKAVLIALIHV